MGKTIKTVNKDKITVEPEKSYEEETDEEDTFKQTKGKHSKHNAEKNNSKRSVPKLKIVKRSTEEVDSDESEPVKKKSKVKIPNVDESSDSEPVVIRKKKIKKEKVKMEYEDVKVVKKNEPKSINTRMSPRSLQKVLESLRTTQIQELEKMGFGAFHSNFNFDSTPSELGMWIVRNFDSKSCSIKMKDGRKLKITRELVRDVLGIPMGDIKVEALEEKNLLEETTGKWRELLKSVVVKDKILISKLEEHLCSLSKVDWEFRVCFLVLFFSIFGQGNKDGEVNERIIPILSNTDNVSQMDWCSYVVECIVKECKGFKPHLYFSGPLLLLAIIYVNSTLCESINVEKTVPAFKSWSTRLLHKRQTEELKFGFGCLPIAEGLELIEPAMEMTPKKEKLNKKHKKSVTGVEEEILVKSSDENLLRTKSFNVHDSNEEFRSKSFEEMKLIIRDNLGLCNQLILDTDYKLNIALTLNPEDEELNKIVEIRKDLFADSYKHDSFEMGKGDKDVKKMEIMGIKIRIMKTVSRLMQMVWK